MKLIEDFNDVASLEFFVASQFVITIWNRPDIVHAITNALRIPDENAVDEMLRRIDDRVLQIFLNTEKFPSALRKDLKAMVTPIGNHIKKIRKYMNFSPYLESIRWEFSVDHWTHYGTVDIKKLSKILVQDERRDIYFRFHLACHNCFEENIRELFPLLTDEQKCKSREIRRKEGLTSYWSYRLTEDLRTFWSLIVQHDRGRKLYAKSEHEIAFNYALLNGSKSGIEYFLDNLPPNRAFVCLRTHTPHLLSKYHLRNELSRYREIFYDAYYFLLAKLNAAARYLVLYKYSSPHLHLRTVLKYPFYGLCKSAKAYLNAGSYERIHKYLCDLKFASNLHLFGYDMFNEFFDGLDQEKQDIFTPIFKSGARTIPYRFPGHLLANLPD